MQHLDLKHRLAGSVVILGFTTLVSQMLFMRELVVVFFGNELCLGALFAVWLFWTAAGSGLLPKVFPVPERDVKRLRWIFFLIACLIPLTDLGINLSRKIIHSTSGEIIGFPPMLLTGLIVFAPICLLSGYAYASACRFSPEPVEKKSRFTVGIYALEAFGSAAGGLFASLLFFPYAAPVQIIISLFALMFYAGLNLQNKAGEKKKQTPFGPVFFVAGVLIMFVIAPKIQIRLDSWTWKSSKLLAAKNTPYGNLAMIRMDSQYSFFENSLHFFTIPDEPTAEETVHYALLEHPAPQKILLIGGSLGGAVEQVFRHPSTKFVHAVELDPEIIRMAEKYLPPEKRSCLTDPRVTFHLTDARRFITQTREKFDAILLNLPNPYTAQLNRFYTVEFFEQVRSRLNPCGVFSFHLPSSENAIGKELSDLLSTVSATLSSTFSNTVLLPGVDCRFLASTGGHYLTSNPDTLIGRIRERNLKTIYIQKYYLRYQLSKERQDYLVSRLHAVPPERINRDFRPLAFWYDLMVWSKNFTAGFKSVLDRFASIQARHLFALFSVIMILVLIRIRKSNSISPVVHLSVLNIGFSGIALELLLLLAYQTLYGVLYQDMAVIVAGYMVGLGLGSTMALRKKHLPVFTSIKHLITFQFLFGLLPLASERLFFLIQKTPSMTDPICLGTVLFICLNILTGFLSGTVFSLANHLIFYYENTRRNVAGKLYALDLVGSMAGALVTTALAAPLIGIDYALFVITGINAFVFTALLFGRKP